MSWKKHFSLIKTAPVVPTVDRSQGAATMTARTSSWLNIAYQGNPQRIPRYYQFQDMDNDSDINTALDTIADFCTQSEEQSDEPFDVKFNGEPNESEVKIIKQMLARWLKLNNLRARLWYMFRDTIKNGDAFYLCDPETFEWLWLDHFSVELVKVDETKGKIPDEYIVRGLDYNRQNKFSTTQADPNAYRTPFGTTTVGGARPMSGSSGPAAFNMAGSGTDQRQRGMQGPYSQDLSVIDAKHVVHLSLSIGNDINWPFGPSILEPIFKTYKQKELLEDAIIIYRVQRAPERRIFYIDVGTMPPERAKRHLEGIKNDIHQRRIPNRTGTGGSLLDAAYNPLCISIDTLIPLLDGRTLPLREIIKEYNEGKKNWVYSCDPITGEIAPGPITWAGETRKDVEVIKITLDSGETLTVTPDHGIPVLGRGKVLAKDLTPDDSLIAFHTRERNIDRTLANERTYTQIFDHNDKKWKYVHRVVGECCRRLGLHQEMTFLPEYAQASKNTIHHVDYNRYNNAPTNLKYMDKHDHVAFHVAERKAYWDGITDVEHNRISQKISNSLKNYYANFTNEQRQAMSEFASIRNKSWIAKKRQDDPEGFAAWRTLVGEGRSAYLRDHPEANAVLSARLRTVCKVIKNQPFQSTQQMLSIIAQTVREHNSNRLETAELLKNNADFIAEVQSANPPREGSWKSNLNLIEITPPRLDKVIADHGYKNWKDFAKKVKLYNHRIVSIESAGRMDVGTITVDKDETYHPHHTFAISAGIFIFNSINDDYFFASSSDGRGSKVETLPGGTGNDTILDLTFFSKKLARGLRVPPSYLNIGADDQASVTFNDGKLGAAMIEEFRFSKYCMRLQALLAPKFDHGFKRYLQKNGIEIEAGLFELQFNPPQSFSRYRQIELDTQRVAVYQGVAENKKLAERFKLERFLGLSEDEIIKNEEQWAEENADKLKKKTGASPAEGGQGEGLSAVGIHPEGDMGGLDMGMPAEGDPAAEAADPGAVGGVGGVGGAAGAAPIGGAAAPPPGA